MAAMAKRKKIVGSIGERSFEFDVAGNAVRTQGKSIALQPIETHVLRTLLNGRGQLTTATSLARARREAGSAAAVREAIASLKRKLAGTGLEIKAKARLGYEIDAFQVPELNRRLSDRILLAMNQAAAAGKTAVVDQLHVAWELAKESERQWLEAQGAPDLRVVVEGG